MRSTNLPADLAHVLAVTMAPKKQKDVDETGKQLKMKPPPEEKYDFGRTQGIDPRDPRASGPPCYGHHVEAKAGRGSVSGSNKFASWTGCEQCKIRLSYTPAYGAHGMTRKAGPLTADTEKALEKIPQNEQKGSMGLRDQKISLDGAETSLLRRLEQVQRQKKDWVDKHPEPKQVEKDATASHGAPASRTCTPTTRKMVRRPAETAEEVEALAAAAAQEIHSDDETGDWSLMSTPPR